jgi:hypothetical protein
VPLCRNDEHPESFHRDSYSGAGSSAASGVCLFATRGSALGSSPSTVCAICQKQEGLLRRGFLLRVRIFERAERELTEPPGGARHVVLAEGPAEDIEVEDAGVGAREARC